MFFSNSDLLCAITIGSAKAGMNEMVYMAAAACEKCSVGIIITDSGTKIDGNRANSQTVSMVVRSFPDSQSGASISTFLFGILSSVN